MNRTAHTNLAQACDAMHVYLQGQCKVLRANYSDFPPARRAAIERLGSAMWREVTEAKADALAQSDEAFQRFKAKVAKLPRKNSTLWREIAG